MQITRWVLIICAGALLSWSVLRWRGTDSQHREYTVRRDMAVLAALLLVGSVADAARSGFPERAPAFIVISVALLPVAVGALWLVFRLVRAYRRLGPDSRERSLRRDQIE